jgi:uncharacterized RDD family membrane protein YckC
MARELSAMTPATAVSPPSDASTPDALIDDEGSGIATDEDAAYSESPAHLGERLLAYALDSVVLFAFTMIFAAIAFANVYFSSDHGRDTASDEAIWRSAYLLLLTVPAWLVLNYLLTAARGYTVGQYVMGLRLRDAQTEVAPRPKRLLFYWFAMHPLLFHPIFFGFWLFFAYVALSISDSTVLFLIGAGLALLCILAPLASLGFIAFDGRRRAMHDLLAGVRVRRLD